MNPSLENILDEYLVLRCQSGDRQAFTKIVERYQTRVSRLAFVRTQDREAANDVAQEVWTSCLKSLKRLKDPRRFQSWLDQIVRHKSSDWIRRQQRQRDRSSEWKDSDDESSSQPDDDTAETRENQIAVLRTELAKLPDQQRYLLTQLYLNNRTVADIAMELEVPIGTIKSRLFHAREKLRQACNRRET